MVKELSPLPHDKKIYFVSDLHLGSPDYSESLKREKLMVKWLEDVSVDAHAIFFLGDIFDFWFEYKHVIPKGFTRFLGKVTQLADLGINIYFFAGNHDMWMFDYFPRELNIPVVKSNMTLKIDGRVLLVGHGDGLGDGDTGYKILKKFFSNPFCQWLFARIHPNLGFRIANYWSMKSRKSSEKEIPHESDRLIQYCVNLEKEKHHDYYIFGHRHKPDTYALSESSTYINLGDWIDNFSYGVYHSGNMDLRIYQNSK